MVVAKEEWQSADATWCVIRWRWTPERVGREGCGDNPGGRCYRSGGSDCHPPAIGERSKQFLGLRARSSAGPRVGSEVEPPRLTYAAHCGTQTVPTAPKLSDPLILALRRKRELMTYRGCAIPDYSDQDWKRIVDRNRIDESVSVFVGDKMRG